MGQHLHHTDIDAHRYLAAARSACACDIGETTDALVFGAHPAYWVALAFALVAAGFVAVLA